MRILFFSSNPQSAPGLNLQEEFRAFDDRLRSDGRSACVELRHIPSGTFDLLERELRAFVPDVLHFSGHGSPESLLLEGNLRQRVEVPHLALGALVERLAPQLRCLVLGFCHSAAQADALLSHVPSLIGMKSDLADSTAIRFSTSFYAALAAGDALHSAFALAQNSTYGTSRPDPRVPTFFFRPGVESLPLARKLQVFSLYAPRDEVAYNELRQVLTVYQRAGVLNLTSRQNAPVTMDQERFCEDALDAANIILCLSSSQFLADGRCTELTQRALRRLQTKQAAVINLLIRSSAWSHTPLGGLQPLPRSGKALSTQRKKDAWWQEVVTELRAVLRVEEAKYLNNLWTTALKKAAAASKPAVTPVPAPAAPVTMVPAPHNAAPSSQAPSPSELLDRLNALLPAEFEMLLMRLNVPVSSLSSATAAQALRAVELLRYLDAQKPSRLPALLPLLSR